MDGDHACLSAGLLAQGVALLGLERLPEAEASYQDVLALVRAANNDIITATALARLAHLALLRGQTHSALHYADESLVLQSAKRPDGTLEPLRSDWACYESLPASADPRAGRVLQRAHTTLMHQAEHITDDTLRESFLRNVPTHRALLDAFEQVNATQIGATEQLDPNTAEPSLHHVVSDR